MDFDLRRQKIRNILRDQALTEIQKKEISYSFQYKDTQVSNVIFDYGLVPEMFKFHGVDVDAGLKWPQMWVLFLMPVGLHNDISLTSVSKSC